MKNKRLIGLGLTLFGLVLMYTGTYAYYMRVVNGTITGKTGAFTFDVLHNNKTFTSIDLYDTITGTPSIESSDKVIVPGDKGAFVLTATGVGTSSDIEYTIMFNGSNVPANMRFYLDEGKTKVLDVETNKIYGYLDKNGSMVKEHTIYWEWPYDSGRYNDLDYEYANKNISIDVKVEGKQSKDGMLVYGVKRNTPATSPAWERVGDSIGLEANAVLPTSSTTVADTGVVNDFDNIYPWSEIKSYNYNANTRKVTAWYGEANFKFDGSNGEVLTYIPGFYYKREVVNGVEYQYISKYEQEGYSYSEPFSIGRYKMSAKTDSSSIKSQGDGKVELMSGIDWNSLVFVGSSASGNLPKTKLPIAIFRESASMLGTDFSMLDYHYFIIQMLYLVEYANDDTISILGVGVNIKITKSAIVSGGTDSLGMKSGCLVNDGKHSMIYRGIEDIGGNTDNFIDGYNMKNGIMYVNYDYHTYNSESMENYKKIKDMDSPNNLELYLYGELFTNPKDTLEILVGGATTYSDFIYGYNLGIFNGEYFSSGPYLSTLQNNYIGSRLIRHQTSKGREVQTIS